MCLLLIIFFIILKKKCWHIYIFCFEVFYLLKLKKELINVFIKNDQILNSIICPTYHIVHKIHWLISSVWWYEPMNFRLFEFFTFHPLNFGYVRMAVLEVGVCDTHLNHGVFCDIEKRLTHFQSLLHELFTSV